MNNLNPYNILMLSTHDVEGGATTWFMHLAEVLYNVGYNIAVVVKYKKSTLSYVYPVKQLPKDSKIKRLVNKYFVHREEDIFFESKPEYAFFPFETEFSNCYSAQQIMDVVPFSPNLIITGLTYELANTSTLHDLYTICKVPIYMTAFDVNVFTGGCHAHFDCQGYKYSCSSCPGIINRKRQKEVQESFAIKLDNIKKANIGVLYAAPWTKYLSYQSVCFEHNPKCDIGMCIDTDFYTNTNRDIAKRIFKLPNNSFVIFAGSANVTDKRKGFISYVESLKLLWDLLPQGYRDNVYIMLAGRNIKQIDKYIKSIPPFHVHYIDFISDFRLLSLAYQASNLFVCSSLEDAGPMMVAEAMSCGTPVVGYRTGLMFDQSIIRNGIEGYSVEIANHNDLARAMRDIVMLSTEEYTEMSNNCRSRAKELLSKDAFLCNVKKILFELEN